MRREMRIGRAAFTLVEILVVVAVVGLVAAMVAPSFIKARKQVQGRRALNDIRQMDAAISHWALENCKTDGDTVDTTAAAPFLKSRWPAVDPLGNGYVFGGVGTNQVMISTLTKAALVAVGIDWGPY